MVSFENFLQSLEVDSPGKEWPLMLKALWYDAKGNWENAHQLIEGLTCEDSALVHAYLHRKEGDRWNAGFWYRKAGSTYPEYSLETEFHQLIHKFIPQQL